MKTTFISNLSMTEASRRSLAQLQVDLVKAQKEVTTGRHADVGLALGHRTGQSVSLRYDHARLTAIIDTNGLVEARLDTTQHLLGSVLEVAQGFLASAIASQNGQIGADVVQPDARAALQALIGSLNSTFNGAHLFAGVNTDVEPLSDYFSDPPSAARSATGAAFLAEFGVSQSSPLADAIPAADMEAFLDTGFAALFDDPAWSSDWSAASDQAIRSRISVSELVDTSVSANHQAFRKLAMAFAMVADLGLENLNGEAARTVLTTATRVVGDAIGELAGLQANLGTVQQQVSRASERMAVQTDILTSRINALETVDPYEAATRVNALLAQIETSYALTGRLQGLSLLNYL